MIVVRTRLQRVRQKVVPSTSEIGGNGGWCRSSWWDPLPATASAPAFFRPRCWIGSSGYSDARYADIDVISWSSGVAFAFSFKMDVLVVIQVTMQNATNATNERPSLPCCFRVRASGKQSELCFSLFAQQPKNHDPQ
jgi:hypothetical protein